MSLQPPSDDHVADEPALACAPGAAALLRQARRMASLSEAPWLHQEVGRRLADKLAPIKLQPQGWIDWSAFLGASADSVRSAYPQAQRWVVEPTPGLQQRSLRDLASTSPRSWKSLWRKDAPKVWLADNLTDAPWMPGGAQMLWANMCLHAHPDLASMMRQWHRQLSVGGFLMCSGLGPDTVRELRAIYRSMGWALPTIDFIDMHDLGDELVKAGFADPVMDMERLTLTWESPQALLKELRTWGGNVAAGRHPGLKTPRWQADLLELLARKLARPDGRLGLTIEVIYGHAIKPEPRIKLESETRVSLDDMRRMVRKQG